MQMMPPVARRALLATVVVLFCTARTASTAAIPDITNYDIPMLESAYSTGQLTMVDALNFYLNRIATYDQGGPDINSVPVLNPDAMAEAQAAEAKIQAGASLKDYPLLGVPIVVKDSYDVAGLPTTNGVGALHLAGPGSVTNLVATTDSFNVAELKAAGAIIIGKANMSTMAYSYDGISDAFGRVLNPYAPLHTPGGSSSGTAATVTSSLAMFGMGGETGGSIRVPSTNNDLIGLKTSAGLIDPGGTWPLTPSRDVVGPITRDVTDIAYAMNALVHPSATNLWNTTPYYPNATTNPNSLPGANAPDYTTFLQSDYLKGKVIAIPRAYDGNSPNIYPDPSNPPPASSVPYRDYPLDPQVSKAFDAAKAELIKLGATVVEVDIPAYTLYSSTIGARVPTLNGFPFAYPPLNSPWSNEAAAYYYEKQIESYHDPVIKNLDDLAKALAASPSIGTAAGDPTGAVNNITNLAVNYYDKGLAEGFGFHVDATSGQLVPDNPDAQKALQAFTDLRNTYYEGFMNNPGNPLFGSEAVTSVTHIDAFAFPTLNYLSPYEAYTGIPDSTSSIYGSLPARTEANALGVPGITVPMGFSTEGIPMSLEFMGHFDGEGPLIGMAYSYEQATNFRADPNLAALPNPPLYPDYPLAVPAPPSLVLGSISFSVLGMIGLARRRAA